MNTATKGKPRVVLLFGPTAVGKTDLLDSLFTGKGEIINADSMQVYKYLDIGTAKPPKDLLLRLPHHLIDILEPHEQFHAGDFLRRSETLVREIHARGKVPVISGGTGFYFKTFLYGLPGTPACDSRIREIIRARLEEEGLEVLREELEKVDPLSAERIESGDSYRILRALEVFYSSGKPLSGFPPPGIVREDMDLLLIGLHRDRDELYRRIETRVDQMFDQGLYGEFRNLTSRGYGPDAPGMKSIGYGEFFQMDRDGCLSLGGVKDLIKTNSRRYAKRQVTFFKPFPRVRWFHPAADRREIDSKVTAFLEQP